MIRTLALVIALGLCVGPAALADIPLPKDLKYVDPRVAFEGVAVYPDHVFYLRYLTFTGGPGGVPHTLVEVKDSKPFNLHAQRRLFDMSLLAMDRKAFEKRAKEDPKLTWLTDKTEGVLKATVNPPPTTASVSLKEVPVTTYRIAIKDGKMTAEKVLPKAPGDAPRPMSLLPGWALGGVLALSLAWLGLWFARRGRTPAPGERGA